MTLSIIILNDREEFIHHLDPDLCELKETCTTNGLRTLSLEYKFQDMKEDKKLFRLGNKVWVQGDNNLTDCLYIINTKVKEDIFKENSFTVELEEVLVELTYAPLILQNNITATNGFKLTTTHDTSMVRVDYNALNNWFGKYFNIGIVQECLSDYASLITVTGTITPMALLRQIEEETGNVFITRYEKDCLTNTIHRYLDFLNPININNNWSLNLDYKFAGERVIAIYDENGNLTTDDKAWDVTPYATDMPSESLNEGVADATHDGSELYEGFTDTAYSEDWIALEQEVIDPELNKTETPLIDLTPDNCVFRITDGENLLNSEGNIYKTGDIALQWDATTAGLSAESNTVTITMVKNGVNLGIDINNKSFVVVGDYETDKEIGYVNAILNDTLDPLYIQDDEDENATISIPDDSYFEIYDSVNDICLFRTCLNYYIGHVHEEVLDLGFNLENIVHNIDETSTYTAVAPILKASDNTDSSNSLTRDDVSNLINRWRNLTVNKGDTVPMILQKINVTADSLALAKSSLGGYDGQGHPYAPTSNSHSNWWSRPYHPTDNTDNENRTYEFWRGTAYWRAPYTKNAGEMHIVTDKAYQTEYQYIHERDDQRDDRGAIAHPKLGTTSSSDEDVFAIYNQVALYLKEHETPKIDLELDVANLRNQKYNDYQIWDKVYVKIPDTHELIQCRITEVTKEAHDIAKNTVKLANYTTNTIKTITKNTIIHADNTSFKYPAGKDLTVTLENLDYTQGDVQYPFNKLLNFTLYRVKDGGRDFVKNYTKKTNVYGQVTLNMKYDPGDYKLEITFGGDEEFNESSTTVKVNVGGVKKEPKTSTNDTEQKTTKKSNTETKKTTYYDKYGRSPDKKKILAIGKRSASRDDGNSGTFYGQEFKNYCPKCKKEGTLMWGIFYAGNETSNWGTFPGTGNREGGSAEGHIFCSNQRCDGDFSCQGHEHGYSGKTLTTTKKRFLSSKSDAYLLKKGKYVYEKVETSNDSKKVSNNKDRKIIGKPSSTIKNKAWEIVGDKTGHEALKEICKWMDNKIDYAGYSNFVRSPERVISTKHGNCCDQTRLLLQLFDAAGLSEYYKMYYIHVKCPAYGHVYAMVTSKKTGNSVYIDPASDTYGCYGYVCDKCPHGGRKTQYPTKPF